MIGAKFDTAGSDPNEVLSVISHATLGCAASAAEGTGCAGGAIGGATSAVLAPMIRDALYDGTQTVTYTDNGNGTIAQATSYDNTAINLITQSLATIAGASAAGLAGANARAGATWAENEVANNALSPKYQYLTAQTQACSGQSVICYQQLLVSTTSAYKQALQDVATNCGSGGNAAACNTAQGDAAQLYLNQKSLQQSVANMSSCTTVGCVVLTTGGTDLGSLLLGAIVGKVVGAVKGAPTSSTVNLSAFLWARRFEKN